MSGSAVTNALVPEITSGEIQKIMTFVIPIVLVVLLVMTDSWFEPFLFLLTIGVAIVLNMGTNLIFGTISFCNPTQPEAFCSLRVHGLFHLPSAPVCRKAPRMERCGEAMVAP